MPTEYDDTATPRWGLAVDPDQGTVVARDVRHDPHAGYQWGEELMWAEDGRKVYLDRDERTAQAERVCAKLNDLETRLAAAERQAAEAQAQAKALTKWARELALLDAHAFDCMLFKDWDTGCDCGASGHACTILDLAKRIGTDALARAISEATAKVEARWKASEDALNDGLASALEERDAARKTVTRLNRRTQLAESALNDATKLRKGMVGGSLGRKLLAWAHAKAEEDVGRLDDAIRDALDFIHDAKPDTPAGKAAAALSAALRGKETAA